MVNDCRELRGLKWALTETRWAVTDKTSVIKYIRVLLVTDKLDFMPRVPLLMDCIFIPACVFLCFTHSSDQNHLPSRGNKKSLCDSILKKILRQIESEREARPTNIKRFSHLVWCCFTRFQTCLEFAHQKETSPWSILLFSSWVSTSVKTTSKIVERGEEKKKKKKTWGRFVPKKQNTIKKGVLM